MNKILIYAAFALSCGTTIITHANAQLVANASSAAGTKCYSDCTKEPCTHVLRCDCPFGDCTLLADKLNGGGCTDRESLDYCYLGISNNSVAVCDTGGEYACLACLSAIPMAPDKEYYSEWSSVGTANAVSRTKSIFSNAGEDGRWACIESAGTEYGCAENMYSDNPPSASMICKACPDAGKSAIGTYLITSCYQNGTFTDNTGSGTYTGNCYWQ